MNDKIVIVSTRLPVSVSKVDGKLHFSQSAGGLATGVSSIKKSKDSVWVGWPGIASDELTEKDKDQITKELKKRGCFPVFLTASQVENFYAGYSNSTLWPQFHYFPSKVERKEAYWHDYKAVNKLFADVALSFSSNNAKFWIHDYQLMLVPHMLRVSQPSASIGFFLHTPFPSFEIFRLIPERVALLEGLMGANLVGFHTYDYVRHFLDSVTAILGHENKLGKIRLKDRVVHTDAFPIGIDYNKFARGAKARSANKWLKSFNVFGRKTKVVLAVDRADYSKGIPSRLDAFEQFLEMYPDQHEKMILVLIAVPSRGSVDAYKDLRDDIEKKIGRINGRFSTINWTPIIYRYQSVPFDELCALYSLADVMLVTPLRDGMNLVAKEYIATHHKDKGVLILSEMAGAAHEFPEALLVNPHDARELATAMHTGLTMKVTEQKSRMRKMQERASEYTIKKWAQDYFTELNDAVKEQSGTHKQLSDKDKKRLLNDYTKAKRRLILLDYDGTLKNFVKSPADILLNRPPRQVKKALKSLTKDPYNYVVVISGRPRDTLEDFFSDKKLGLVAEHGGWVFDASGWIKSSVHALKWKKAILPIMEKYVARTPGSELEEKDFSFVWHYRRVTPDLAYVRKEELQQKLRSALKDDTIGVFEGDKIIEVKPKKMNKGIIAQSLLVKEDWDFVLCAGDDYTDEDMFEVMPKSAYSIKVGVETTSARYQLNGVDDIMRLLTEISSTDKP
jgi:trehalose 6-phosphate synthase/phosphatase